MTIDICTNEGFATATQIDGKWMIEGDGIWLTPTTEQMAAIKAEVGA